MSDTEEPNPQRRVRAPLRDDSTEVVEDDFEERVLIPEIEGVSFFNFFLFKIVVIDRLNILFCK